MLLLNTGSFIFFYGVLLSVVLAMSPPLGEVRSAGDLSPPPYGLLLQLLFYALFFSPLLPSHASLRKSMIGRLRVVLVGSLFGAIHYGVYLVGSIFFSSFSSKYGPGSFNPSFLSLSFRTM